MIHGTYPWKPENPHLTAVHSERRRSVLLRPLSVAFFFSCLKQPQRVRIMEFPQRPLFFHDSRSTSPILDSHALGVGGWGGACLVHLCPHLSERPELEKCCASGVSWSSFLLCSLSVSLSASCMCMPLLRGHRSGTRRGNTTVPGSCRTVWRGVALCCSRVHSKGCCSLCPWRRSDRLYRPSTEKAGRS